MGELWRCHAECVIKSDMSVCRRHPFLFQVLTQDSFYQIKTDTYGAPYHMSDFH